MLDIFQLGLRVEVITGRNRGKTAVLTLLSKKGWAYAAWDHCSGGFDFQLPSKRLKKLGRCSVEEMLTHSNVWVRKSGSRRVSRRYSK